jgi:hypothetical protein
MKRDLAALATAVLAAICIAGSALAAGASGKVVSTDAEKVVVQLDKGKGASFPVGMKDVEVKGGGGSVRGRVTASSGDKVTVKVVKGKASSLSVGASVEVGQSANADAEGIDGC